MWLYGKADQWSITDILLQLVCQERKMSLFSMETLYLLGLLNFFVVTKQLSGWTINVPTKVTATEGSCVVVPCHTQPHLRVIWYMYDSKDYPKVYDKYYPDTVEDQFRGRTSLVGEAMEGNCSLKIDDVRRDDNNVQIYVWINPISESYQAFLPQLVTIIVEKITPLIAIKEGTMSDGDIFEAYCLIYYSCPSSRPSLNWSRSPFLENSTLTAQHGKKTGLWFYNETLLGVATYKMHKSKIRCSAKSNTITANSKDIVLNVFYEPMTVTLTTDQESVAEGDSIIIECVTDCNPQPHMYSWLRRRMGQSDKINSTQGKMSFNNITRDTSFSCVAHNYAGAGESHWLDLVVQYPPKILPKSMCNLIGETLRCVCQADASPDALMYWTINGNDTLPSFVTSVSMNERHFVIGELIGPVQSLPNVSCKANNSLGSTKLLLLSATNSSKTSSPNMGLLPIMLLGIPLLLCCAMFICRGYPRNRPRLGEANIQGSHLRTSMMTQMCI
ncbi:myelin-associated glycoprotein-like [Genypterus blacodes]|uniref:myelin-associated glycoprotein-like n=1 Tax=Genypterus blacodes TaxID=154954 RepID=UPI003F76D2CD